jgi:hypothetical protein
MHFWTANNSFVAVRGAMGCLPHMRHSEFPPVTRHLKAAVGWYCLGSRPGEAASFLQIDPLGMVSPEPFLAYNYVGPDVKDAIPYQFLRMLWWMSIFAGLLGAERLQASEVIAHPYQGITYINRTETAPRTLTMHIVKVDLTAPGISFKLTPPGGTRETIRQTTLDFLNQQQAQVAINSHFFLPFPSSDTNATLAGLAASDGVVYSPFEPQPVGPGYTNQSYAILFYAPALNIDSANQATIVHRDPGFPDNKHVLEPVTLWTTLAGSAQIVTSGIKTIPTYSGSPNGLNSLSGYSDSNSWYALLRARTAIGLTADNHTLILFTVDQAGGSGGMSGSEVADTLINDYQVYNALNLDGGGSTTLAMQDPVTHTGALVNVSSDNPQGRAVGSNLAVFALPMPGPPPRLTITVTETNTVVLAWPASASGWHLEESPDLAPNHWLSVSTPPQPAGDQMQVVVAPLVLMKFYRLSWSTNNLPQISRVDSDAYWAVTNTISRSMHLTVTKP